MVCQLNRIPSLYDNLLQFHNIENRRRKMKIRYLMDVFSGEYTDTILNLTKVIILQKLSSEKAVAPISGNRH